LSNQNKKNIFETTKKNIKTNVFKAERLPVLLQNIMSSNELSLDQKNDLKECIKLRMRNELPKKATLLFGSRSSEAREILTKALKSIKAEMDLSNNAHNNSVKTGGVSRTGEWDVYEYISYREENIKMLAHLAITKLKKEDELKVVATKCPVEQQSDDFYNPYKKVFQIESFESALELYQIYLGDTLSGKVFKLKKV
jgi:hypothetical protein|tara:strand:+ start:2255 stop:2845 length:591 start_codon:yes stop_codon:yes gene_type:complete